MDEKEFIKSVVEEYTRLYLYEDADKETLEYIQEQIAKIAATFLICQEKLNVK